jgi:DNA-binding NarL/FixJ family response regulator
LIRLVIADDHELLREGVKKIFRAAGDMKVVGEAGDLAQTIKLVGQHAPDVVVLDLSLPGYEGLAGLAELRQRFPEQRVVILSMYAEERYALPALKAGARGYITKSMAAEELVKAVRAVVAGGTYVGARLAALRGQGEAADAHQALTPREREILALIGAGLQVKQAAAELGISVSSVNTYRNRIFQKLGLHSNAGLIRYALQHGLAH